MRYITSPIYFLNQYTDSINNTSTIVNDESEESIEETNIKSN